MIMAIPDFETIMLPLLKIVSDGKEWSMRELEKVLMEKFNLSDEEKHHLKSSSKHETLFQNRMRWARFYLKKAGLLVDPRRGFTKIIERGLEVVKKNPDKIDIEYLKQFPEFVEFYTRSASKKQENISASAQTPEDEIITGIEHSTNTVKFELLEKMKNMDPFAFEMLNGLLLQAMGYGEATITKRSGDGGIDGYVTKDVLGFEKIRFQSKRYSETVPIDKIRAFLGTIGQGKKGIMITTSDYSSGADNALRENQRSSDDIKFIDGEKLTELMLKYSIGNKVRDTYRTYELDDESFA